MRRELQSQNRALPRELATRVLSYRSDLASIDHAALMLCFMQWNQIICKIFCDLLYHMFHRGKTQWEKLPDVDALARCCNIDTVRQLAI